MPPQVGSLRHETARVLGGAAAAWPHAARAQQPGRLPTIGFLGVSTSSAWTHWTAAFVRRLPGRTDAGYVEGENVAILYRYAETRMDRLPGWPLNWFVGRSP